MAQQTIDIGSAPNDGTGDPIRDAFDKCNDNFTELYTGLTGLLDFKGSTDCSANPNYPAASKGDFYLVSVAGKIGGASGIAVEAGDSFFATADNAGGTQAGVGSSWTVIQGNITSYLPLSGGTLTGDLVVPAEAYGAGWDGSNEVPTKNDVYDKIEAVVAGGGYSDEQAQDAVGGILTDSSTVAFVYSDATPSITATVKGLPVTTQSGTSYTAVLADANSYIQFTNGSAVTFTIPTNASEAFAVGAVIVIEQNGAGVVTIAPAGGVTLNSRGALLNTAGQYAVAQVKKVATNTWTVIGDVA